MELKKKVGRILIDKVIFFNIDIQKGNYLMSLYKAKSMMQVATKLMKYSKIMQIPVLVSTQNKKVFGETCELIKAQYHDKVTEFEKSTFSAVTKDVIETLKTYDSVVLYGCEAHVCLQQSCLDLLELGLQVHLCTDGITSKMEGDRNAALRRMENAGALITTSESVMFEILKDSKNPKFKECLEVIKDQVYDPFISL